MPLQASFWRGNRSNLPEPTKIVPFAGRIGANQEFSVDKNSCAQKELLVKFPDAAPWIPLRDALSLRNILQRELWKGAVIEAIGTCLLAYLTCFVAIGLGNVVETFQSGALVPSLLGSVIAMFTLPLFIFAAGPVSGAHLNPTITIATFFGRLATLSRCILYIAFQTFGGAVAGWLLRASFNTRSFIVPGCYVDLSTVSVGSAFAVEFTTDFALIFLSFGVGLDPRQREVFGPALGPIFVGIVLGVCTFMTGFSIPGYTGFCMVPQGPASEESDLTNDGPHFTAGNPARCFAAMVGSHFVSYHWIHWIGPLAAAIAHGVLYQLVPPYSRERMATDGESLS